MNEAGSLTPNDLRNQEFRSKMRGFDPLEVSAVLEEVAAQWEQLLAENLRLHEQKEAVEGQLKKYADLEQTLRDTLVLARKAAEGEAETAKKEAGLMVEQARLKSQALINEAEARAQEFSRQIFDLQTQRNRLKTEMEALLRSFIERLEHFDTRIETPSGKNAAREDDESTMPAKPLSHLPPVRPAEPEPPTFSTRGTSIPVPVPDTPESGEEQSIDFDAALNKIFGEGRDTPVPPAGEHKADQGSSGDFSPRPGESESRDTDKQNTDSAAGSGSDR